MRISSTVPFSLAICLAAMLTACGGTTGPTVPTLNGAWTLNLTNLSGAGISCNATGMTMTLNQSATSFSGSFNGGVLTCVDGGQGFSDQIGNGTVLDGVVSGNLVAFDLGSPDLALNGTISGTSMSGGCTWRIDLGVPYGVIVLSGSWGAARRS